MQDVTFSGEKQKQEYSYITDEQGSLRYILNADRQTETYQEYSAFGERIFQEGASSRLGYNSQMGDELTGLTYLRARYYKSEIGRFTQEDVIYDDGFNLYAYCGSNPVIYCDPSGFAKKPKVIPDNNCKGKEGGESESRGDNTSESMLGANGTQVSSKTTWQNGKTERIDVENPSPGQRAGQVHYHDANNNKYCYDIDNNKFYDQRTGKLAPPNIQKLLKDKDFMNGIKKALKILGV